MTLFDFFVLAVVAASVMAGALRGIVRALFVGAALVVGLLAAARGYEWAGSALRWFGLFEQEETAWAGGFLLIAGAAVVAGFALGQIARAGLKRARAGWFDGGLGAAFGLARGIALCSAVYLALTAFPVRIEAVTEARTAPALAAGARVLSLCTSAEVRERFLTEYRRTAHRL
jgi:membrane protein required for colicin V production